MKTDKDLQMQRQFTVTCEMGKDEACVAEDSKGRVFGVEELRVVGALLLPFVSPGHLRASVCMLADKIAGEFLNWE